MSDSSERDAVMQGDAGPRPLSRNPELAGDANLSTELPGIADELQETVRCDDYRAHQSAHRRVGDGWVCDACASNAAARELELPIPKNATPPEPAELGDWLAAPVPAPYDPASDEWGTIG